MFGYREMCQCYRKHLVQAMWFIEPGKDVKLNVVICKQYILQQVRWGCGCDGNTEADSDNTEEEDDTGLG
jgi:hypothetical protein